VGTEGNLQTQAIQHTEAGWSPAGTGGGVGCNQLRIVGRITIMRQKSTAARRPARSTDPSSGGLQSVYIQTVRWASDRPALRHETSHKDSQGYRDRGAVAS